MAASRRLWNQQGAGARTMLVSAGMLLLVLVVIGSLEPWVALASILALAIISFGRGEFVRTQPAPLLPPVPLAGEAPAKQLLTGAGLSVINELPTPLILLEPTGRVLLVNRAAVPIVGPKAAGKLLASLLRSPDILRAVAEAARGEVPGDVELEVGQEARSHYQVGVRGIIAQVAADPARVEPGAPAAILLLFHDVTSAKRLEEMRTDFIANASHELRTPLASMRGFIETLMGHAKDDPAAQERFLGIMAEQAARMGRLIDDLLSLSRIEMREHMRPSARVDVRQIVDSVTDTLMPLAAESGLALTVDAANDLPPTLGDRDELAQVFQNIIENAIKYGRDGKQVTITLAEELAGTQPQIRVDIADQGPGIAREHLPRLTERFYRVDPATSRERGGTGLGLAIVKHILNRHRGTLAIQSQVGRGSTFTVRLPVAGAEPGA